MDPGSAALIGIASLVALLALLALRAPIGIALGLVSLVGIMILRGPNAAFQLLGGLPFAFSASWTLSAVPMFLLMGALAFRSGLTASLYDAARLFLGRMPGGLAVATNFASAGFAAASGSSLATAAAMGRLAIPEMLRYRYDPALATSVVAAAGTLGALIPPSIAMVIYGWFAEQPIGKLLIAGILPGLLTAFIYAAMIIVRSLLNPKLAPPIDVRATRAEKLAALIDVWPIPVLILGVIGGIYGGVTTPTEAGAFGALLTAVIALVKRKLTLSVLLQSLFEAARTTAVIFMIGFSAILFTRFLAFSGVPGLLTDMIQDSQATVLHVVLVAMLIYLVLGMFLDPLGLMLLTLPILVPAFEQAGVNMIWAGVLIVKFLEIGFITPPVGMNAFVIKAIVGDQVALTTIFRGLAWFIAMEVIITGLLIAFPEISLLLPDLMD